MSGAAAKNRTHPGKLRDLEKLQPNGRIASIILYRTAKLNAWGRKPHSVSHFLCGFFRLC